MFHWKQNSSLSYYTHYTPSELCGCVRVLHRLFCFGPGRDLPAIREKYSQHRVSVSNIRVLADENYVLCLIFYSGAKCPTLYLLSVQICCKEVLPSINPHWVLRGCNPLEAEVNYQLVWDWSVQIAVHARNARGLVVSWLIDVHKL
jgi:hypothetical protein